MQREKEASYGEGTKNTAVSPSQFNKRPGHCIKEHVTAHPSDRVLLD